MWQFCLNSLTLMPFQTCMTFFLLQKTKYIYIYIYIYFKDLCSSNNIGAHWLIFCCFTYLINTIPVWKDMWVANNDSISILGWTISLKQTQMHMENTFNTVAYIQYNIWGLKLFHTSSDHWNTVEKSDRREYNGFVSHCICNDSHPSHLHSDQ